MAYRILAAYITGINVLTFIAYGMDKRKAKRKQWRVPEARLLTMAALGGSLGAWLGMQIWHHKTLHWKFRLGVPLIIIIQLMLALWCATHFGYIPPNSP